MILKWQDLENEIDAVLKSFMRSSPIFYQRFYDSKSAGNLLPPQPSDFLAISKGRSHYIEAKFSEVHETLRSCFAHAVSGNQTASARLVTRAGAFYWFVFYSMQTQQFEVWDGLYCSERRSLGKPLELEKRVIYKSLEDVILGGIFNGHRAHVHRPAPWVAKKI